MQRKKEADLRSFDDVDVRQGPVPNAVRALRVAVFNDRYRGPLASAPDNKPHLA